MRKLFWGLGFCGAFVYGTTAWAAYHAHHHPESFIGCVMKGASHASATLNPIGGFGPVVAKLKQKPLAADEVDGIPADPEPVESLKPADSNENVASVAPIVIPDDEVVETKPVIRPVQHEAFAPETECPAAPVCRAPAVMPFCRDEEECEVLPMPAVEKDEHECEVLPMPAIEVGEEEQETPVGFFPGCPHGMLGKLFRMMVPQPPTQPTSSDEPAKSDECREDPHHYHRSVCPGVDRPAQSCPAPVFRVPSCDPPKPAGGEEPSESAEPSDSKSALRKLRLIETRESIELPRPAPWTMPGVDTMEMRPSDRPAGDYGPGLL